MMMDTKKKLMMVKKISVAYFDFVFLLLVVEISNFVKILLEESF